MRRWNCYSRILAFRYLTEDARADATAGLCGSLACSRTTINASLCGQCWKRLLQSMRLRGGSEKLQSVEEQLRKYEDELGELKGQFDTVMANRQRVQESLDHCKRRYDRAQALLTALVEDKVCKFCSIHFIRASERFVPGCMDARAAKRRGTHRLRCGRCRCLHSFYCLHQPHDMRSAKRLPFRCYSWSDIPFTASRIVSRTKRILCNTHWRQQTRRTMEVSRIRQHYKLH